MPEPHQFRRQRGMLDDDGIDEVVVQHHVGLLQALDAAQRDQAGMAGTGTDQIDRSRAIA